MTNKIKYFLEESKMPRKSPRTATKTYSRKQLMWDEASDVNHIHDDSLIFPSTASVAKKVTTVVW